MATLKKKNQNKLLCYSDWNQTFEMHVNATVSPKSYKTELLQCGLTQQSYMPAYISLMSFEWTKALCAFNNAECHSVHCYCQIWDELLWNRVQTLTAPRDRIVVTSAMPLPPPEGSHLLFLSVKASYLLHGLLWNLKHTLSECSG